MTTLQEGENLAAAVAQTPNRVTLESLMAKIGAMEFFNPSFAPHVTVAVIQTANGFTLVGKSAPADPANFDAEAGRIFARDDAIRQMWALEGYLLRERLSIDINRDPLPGWENAPPPEEPPPHAAINVDGIIDAAVTSLLALAETGNMGRIPEKPVDLLVKVCRAHLAEKGAEIPLDLRDRCNDALLAALMGGR